VAITILVTGQNLKPVIDPVSTWTSVECTQKHNDVGSGTFTAPNTVKLYNAVSTPNNRVCVIRNGAVFMSGPIEHPGDYKWSADSASEAGPGVLTVNFASNELYLAERLTYPAPTLAATAQNADYFVDNGRAAELVMRTLFDKNIGLNALAARKPAVPMGLGTLAGVGAVVNLSTRFEVLTDVYRKLCTAGGNLGFRMRDGGTGLLFEVFAPRDRTKIVQFSRGRNNLRSLSTSPEAPTGTVALVGGANSGAARLMVERASSTPWRRMEHFVNESGLSDTTGLQQSGDHANADKAERVGLTATAVDSPGCRFGVDYLLGDKVAVELATGVLVTDVVRAVKLTATPEAGEVVSPTIGLSDPHTDTPTVRAVRDLYRRLGRLERT
jgi:Siphovirus ReqiPepy6 Gp37-like protein